MSADEGSVDRKAKEEAGAPDADRSAVPPTTPNLSAITPSIARFYRILPLGAEDGRLVIATAREDHHEIESEIRALAGAPVRIVRRTSQEIEEGLRERYGVGGGKVEGLAESGTAGPSILAPRVQDLAGATQTFTVATTGDAPFTVEHTKLPSSSVD